jgi:hypothetical protein
MAPRDRLSLAVLYLCAAVTCVGVGAYAYARTQGDMRTWGCALFMCVPGGRLTLCACVRGSAS